MADFFIGFTGEQLIIMLVGALISIVQAGWPDISILEWLKVKLGLADFWMHVVVSAFFWILAAAAMLVTGEFVPASITWNLQTIITYFGVFYGLSQLAWHALSNSRQ